MACFHFPALILGAALLWLRDPRWLDAPVDLAPVLAALPLFYWLGRPWGRRVFVAPLAPGALVAAALLAAVGMALNATLPLALGWTCLLWASLRCRCDAATRRRAWSLLVLPVMAFPWLASDAWQLGWWFRLSAAWTAEQTLAGIGWTVTRVGVDLHLEGLSVRVDAACSGLNALQTMLVGGAALAHGQLGRRARVAWYAPVLCACAWSANTLRVILTCAAAKLGGRAWAVGQAHEFQGILLVVLMFALCAGVFTLGRRWAMRRWAARAPSPAAKDGRRRGVSPKPQPVSPGIGEPA